MTDTVQYMNWMCVVSHPSPERIAEDVGDLVPVHDACPGGPRRVHRPMNEVVLVHTAICTVMLFYILHRLVHAEIMYFSAINIVTFIVTGLCCNNVILQ
jgi:hypothetical protein